MSPCSVLVGGDFVVDHHIYEGRRTQYGDIDSPGVRVVPKVGGAALIRDLLVATRPYGKNSEGEDEERDEDQREAKALLLKHDAVSVTVDEANQIEEAPESQRAYAFWRPHSAADGKAGKWWRVSEAMGFGPMKGTPKSAVWDARTCSFGAPGIIVLSDGGMGCGDDAEYWESLPMAKAEWLVLKTVAPLGKGPLWDHLKKNDLLKKLVVVVSASDLRQEAANISKGMSWERTLTDLLRELRDSPALSELAGARHLVVSFGSEGGAWIDFDGEPTNRSKWRLRFVGEMAASEGNLAERVDGRAFGALSCIAASVVHRLARNIDGLGSPKPDLVDALKGGLAASRDLLLHGHGPAGEIANGLPASRLAAIIGAPDVCYSTAECSGDIGHGWSMIEQARAPDERAAYQLSKMVLIRGPISLANLSHLRVNDLIATDRHEIEAIRTIRDMIRYYKDTGSEGKAPLSIGTFGPPGSGKSFAVNQLANDLVGKDAWLEFNLSQFASQDELIGAFHQVRDRVLEKQLPVVFFDEFDSQNYKWLRYLLAPMQDGRFREGQLTHTLGKCIFLFAGATSWTYGTFGPDHADPDPDVQKAREHFVFAKGPDFKSRLDGYLDVSGPNARWLESNVAPGSRGVLDSEQIGVSTFVRDEKDVCFPIRRALMIRAKLKCKDGEVLDIDEGVTRALLSVDKLVHGARSLDKILQPFKGVMPGPLRRSHLPPHRQLAMQVPDVDRFLEICNSVRDLEGPSAVDAALVDQLAPAIHESYRALGKREGWIRDKPKMDVKFDELSDPKKSHGPDYGKFLQDSNRAAAGRLPRILALAALELIPLGSGWSDRDRAAIANYLESRIDVLAAEEHLGWDEWHRAKRYTYGKTKDHKKKEHPCIGPFASLTPIMQERDRDSVRQFPEHAVRIDKKIVFIAPWAPK